MPGNILSINDSKELELYIGGSKMDDLIKHLGDIVFITNEDEENGNITSSDVSS